MGTCSLIKSELRREDLHQPSRMPNLKLTYFDLWGRGETTRMLLSIAGIPFEDVRIPIGDPKWETLKPNTPWGTLPTLEVDGKVLGQSRAVHRYTAKLTGMAGKSVMVAGMADSLVDGISDVYDGGIGIMLTPPETHEAGKATYLEKSFKPFCDKVEKMVAGSYLTGESMNWADIHFYVCFKQLVDFMGAEILDGHPKIKAVYGKVSSDPKIKAYVDSHPPPPAH